MSSVRKAERDLTVAGGSSVLPSPEMFRNESDVMLIRDFSESTANEFNPGSRVHAKYCSDARCWRRKSVGTSWFRIRLLRLRWRRLGTFQRSEAYSCLMGLPSIMSVVVS